MISIIVPVYNAALTIQRCIDSIIEQSYKDWELILVDDGSTDDSTSICELNSTHDNRILYIRKTNGGVSSARNVGLDNAHGSLITFLDSDDFFAKDTLLKMFEECREEGALCIWGASFVDENGNTSMWRSFEDKYYSITDDYGPFLRYGTVWGKLFSKNIIDKYQIRFDETICNGEDCLFFWTYLRYVSSIKTSSYCGYLYYKPSIGMSLTTSVGDPYKWSMSYELLQKEFESNITKKYYVNEVDMLALRAFIAGIARSALVAAYEKKIPIIDRKRMYDMLKCEINYYIATNSLKAKIEKCMIKVLPFRVYDMLRTVLLNA